MINAPTVFAKCVFCKGHTQHFRKPHTKTKTKKKTVKFYKSSSPIPSNASFSTGAVWCEMALV